jgi:hypothetical protein
MPLTRFKLSAIEDGGIATADLADGAVTTAKLADSAVTSVKTSNLFTNTEIAGTEAARMPVGTTAERANEQSGDIRFNSTTSLMEYYDGAGWKSIDSAPLVSSVSPSNIADSDSDVDITITGSFFSSGATVKAIGSDASEISAGTVTFTNSTTLVANFDGTSFSDALEDYDIQVTNLSGLSGTLADCLAVNESPAWTVASGSLGTIYDSARTGISFTTGATDDEGATLTYSVSVGSLPAGLSISSSTGTISGTATAVGSDTTSTFTLSVTDGTNTATRQYSIIVKAPTVTSYTSTGSGTFSVPSGITSVDVLVVAGGGGGGCWVGSGAGAGGLIYRPAFPVTPGGSISYTVGAGGGGATNSGYSQLGDAQPNQLTEYRGNEAVNAAKAGQDSVFGTLTALGGGRGGCWANSNNGEQGHLMGNGGSGGGSPAYTTGAPQLGGTKISDFASQGLQPSQPGDSGTYGFGNAGGWVAQSEPFPALASGGGGGAGAVGGQAQGQNNVGGSGGIGKQYDISGTQTYYAGGGGGGVHGPSPGTAGQGGTGGGGAGRALNPDTATPGTANTGGGGGGAGRNGGSYSKGGDGGSGIVIVKY